MYDPGMAGKIVNACAVLHNMRLYYRLPLQENWNEDMGAVHANINVENANLDRCVRGPRAIAERIQKQIMQERFPTFACAWENN